jgi:hypothetical protein
MANCAAKEETIAMTKDSGREKRLATSLRANLRRRKQQARQQQENTSKNEGKSGGHVKQQSRAMDNNRK